jgi:hypothetical protein
VRISRQLKSAILSRVGQSVVVRLNTCAVCTEEDHGPHDAGSKSVEFTVVLRGVTTTADGTRDCLTGVDDRGQQVTIPFLSSEEWVGGFARTVVAGIYCDDRSLFAPRLEFNPSKAHFVYEEQ